MPTMFLTYLAIQLLFTLLVLRYSHTFSEGYQNETGFHVGYGFDSVDYAEPYIVLTVQNNTNFLQLK